MKKYSVNCHYDMVVTVEVTAASESDALRQAYDLAAEMPLDNAECMNHHECVTDVQEICSEEKKRLMHKTIIDYVHEYVDEIVKDESRKAELADIVYNRHRLSILPWADRLGNEVPEWQRKIFFEAYDWYGDFGMLCNRYARLYAYTEFKHIYKNFAKSLFEANVKGCDKMQKKQAVMDGVKVLCDKMEEYVINQDEPDYKGWEPQMIVRYESETGDEENYWNLFVYCEGPNGRDDDDFLSLRTAWQHVWLDEDGKDATDDYGSEEHETRAALLRYLFYNDPQEFDETDEKVIWDRITDVWVD